MWFNTFFSPISANKAGQDLIDNLKNYSFTLEKFKDAFKCKWTLLIFYS